MKDNKEVLSESFFSRDTYSEKIAKKMPQYAPVPTGNSAAANSSNVLSNGVFAVKDAGEMKKRLAGTFGAAFGANSIKSMAGKAIKTFPILVSDNIEPETVIMLKKLMEEQYADYISLLVSNKVIDLSAYSTANDGETIAIQALDDISGTDFSKTRVADKAARTGNISADDVMMNVPLWNLIREHANCKVETGNPLADTLFEGAIVVSDEDVEKTRKYILENADSISEMSGPLNEVVYDATQERRANIVNRYNPVPVYPKKKKTKSEDYETLDDYIGSLATKNTGKDYDAAKTVVLKQDRVKDNLRGLVGLDDEGNEVYDKLSNTDIVLDKRQLDSALNRTVGEFLYDPRNVAIKDRFEKATILLQSEMICGSEYIDYCTMRLGLPMSREVRAKIVQTFRTAKSPVRTGNYKNNIMMTKADLKTIKKNEQLYYSKIAPGMMRARVGDVIAGVATAGATTGGIAALAFGAGSANFWNPVGWALLAAAAVGGSAYLIARLTRNRFNKKYKNKIEGWERVEALIEKMDQQRADITNQFYGKNYSAFQDKSYAVMNDKSSISAAKGTEDSYKKNLKQIEAAEAEQPMSEDDFNELFLGMQKKLKAQGTGKPISEALYVPEIPEEMLRENVEELIEAYKDCAKDPDFESQLLSESVMLEKKSFTTAMPMKVKYIEKNPNKDLLITPAFAARSELAYGSVEIDPKLVKDRKYNQPLLMTIKFKERHDDGKYSDNELTAVIGILGKVYRVPSEEMKYILAANSEGQTIRNAMDGKDIKNAVADLLNVSKVNDEIKKLPQSGEIWNNLEKVATLAMSNKISGKRSSNIANAHIIFSEKEIDEVRLENNIDYKRDMKLTNDLMKRYSAFTLMIADDPAQRVYIYDGSDDISWNVVPYNALMGKDTGDQLTAALARLGSRI